MKNIIEFEPKDNKWLLYIRTFSNAPKDLTLIVNRNQVAVIMTNKKEIVSVLMPGMHKLDPKTFTNLKKCLSGSFLNRKLNFSIVFINSLLRSKLIVETPMKSPQGFYLKAYCLVDYHADVLDYGQYIKCLDPTLKDDSYCIFKLFDETLYSLVANQMRHIAHSNNTIYEDRILFGKEIYNGIKKDIDEYSEKYGCKISIDKLTISVKLPF